MSDSDRLIRPYSSLDADAYEGQVIDELMARSQAAIPDPDLWLTSPPEANAVISQFDWVIGWARQYSLWPMMFGLACCAFEMMSAVMPRFDMSRFGMEVMRGSPRQADLIIVSGTLTWKMEPAVRRLYDQMAEPKWVIAMGSCAISGGTFSESHSVVPGVNRIIPVDIYVPGCPPRPEGLLHGITMLHEKIRKSQSLQGNIHLPRLD